MITSRLKLSSQTDFIIAYMEKYRAGTTGGYDISVTEATTGATIYFKADYALKVLSSWDAGTSAYVYQVLFYLCKIVDQAGDYPSSRLDGSGYVINEMVVPTNNADGSEATKGFSFVTQAVNAGFDHSIASDPDKTFEVHAADGNMDKLLLVSTTVSYDDVLILKVAFT